MEQDGDEKEEPIQELFPDEMLLAILSLNAPWFADIVNFISSGKLSEEFNSQQRKKLIYNSKYYFWDEPYLWKLCINGIIRRCVGKKETGSILQHYHRMINGGHFGPQRTTAKVLEVGFFWPTLFHDARKFVFNCDAYQRSGNFSKKDEMLQSGILDVEIFNVWGIDFMGPFSVSNKNKYILVCVD